MTSLFTQRMGCRSFCRGRDRIGRDPGSGRDGVDRPRCSRLAGALLDRDRHRRFGGRRELYLVPVRGSDADWYKNVLKTPTIRLAAGGAQVSANASPISDAAKVNHVLGTFRAKYGGRDVEAYHPRQDVAVELPLA